MREAILTEGQPLFEDKDSHGTTPQKDRRDALKADIQAAGTRKPGTNRINLPQGKIREGSGVRTASNQLARRLTTTKRIDLRGQDASTLEKLGALGQVWSIPESVDTSEARDNAQ